MKLSSSKKLEWFAWCMYDWANSAFATVILAAVLPVYFVSLVPEAGARLRLLGATLTMPAASLWSYAVALSMLLVAVSAPFLGALADRYGWRRRLTIVFCLVGSSATGLLAIARHGDYLLAAGLFVVANVGFAAGNICYNSFLPILAKGRELERLSSWGFAAGYIGGGLALLLVAILIRAHRIFGLPDSSSATRISFLLTGIWWALFALPTLLILKRDPPLGRPALPIRGVRGYFSILAEICGHRDLVTFLIAFLFYNDGLETIIVISAIFAAEELGLPPTTILTCFLMIQFLAVPGTLLLGRLATRFGPKRILLASLYLLTAVTAYATFMEAAWEFWLLAVTVALLLGGNQALSRSLYASLLPPGKSAEFYGFYSISGKFASLFGPLTFGLVADFTGSLRLATLSLTFFFAAGIVLLKRVNVERGREQAASLA